MSKLNEAFVIVANDGRTEVGWCTGPDELGHCPKVAWGDVVPCAGHQLRVKAVTGPDSLRGVVPEERDACPIPSQPAKRTAFVLIAVGTITGVLIAGAGIAIAATAIAGG